MHLGLIREGAFILIFSGVLAAQAGSRPNYMDISFSSLFATGWTSAKEPALRQLQGGAHDPRQRGFGVQNLELSFAGAVDPYLNGEAHLIFQIDETGESILEVEEAFLTTRSMPLALQVKAGTFFTEFGRLNPQHPHSWSFVDQPLISTRMMGGDGLRGPAARLSWLSPLPWYAEFLLGAHNPRGETAFSFLSGEPEFAGYPLVQRGLLRVTDLVRSARWLNSANLGPEITFNLGASGLWGPNSTGSDGKTTILGTDLYLKWQPQVNDRGWPFVALQAEVMSRQYVAAPDSGAGMAGETLVDNGWYAQLLWGFRPSWVAAVRHELATGSGAEGDDPLRSRRARYAGNLSYYPSEFSKLRLQLNLDRASHLDEQIEWGLWLQFEFLLGQHAGHKF